MHTSYKPVISGAVKHELLLQAFPLCVFKKQMSYVDKGNAIAAMLRLIELSRLSASKSIAMRNDDREMRKISPYSGGALLIASFSLAEFLVYKVCATFNWLLAMLRFG